MKKILVFIVAALFSANVFAQSEKYIKAMEQLVAAVDTTSKLDDFISLGNSFERIANAEKTQWLPYYYAGLCYVNACNSLYGSNTSKIDPLMDKAEPWINKANELQPDNSEIYCLIKMKNTARMMADPQSRFMQLAAPAAQAIEKAKALNPNNPRVFLLLGIDKLYTPEQFGGSKTEALKLFEQSTKLFETAKPESSIHPRWGAGQVAYLSKQAN